MENGNLGSLNVYIPIICFQPFLWAQASSNNLIVMAHLFCLIAYAFRILCILVSDRTVLLLLSFTKDEIFFYCNIYSSNVFISARCLDEARPVLSMVSDCNEHNTCSSKERIGLKCCGPSTPICDKTTVWQLWQSIYKNLVHCQVHLCRYSLYFNCRQLNDIIFME